MHVQLQCDYHDHDFDANDCNLIDSHFDPEDNLYKNHVHVTGCRNSLS